MHVSDWAAIRLTATLAAVTTALLLVGTPLAWRLARTSSRLKPVIGAVVTLPLVLPPTVLGFYLLPFTFGGLVVASVLYSMPFVVQPLQQAFEAIPEALLEAAATLRAGPWDRFVSIALPLARPGLLTGAVLGFAHTVGEFGVVLMIGGSIPGETRVLSVAIYDHVEAAEFADAHRLAAGMVAFALVVLVTLYAIQRSARVAETRR